MFQALTTYCILTCLLFHPDLWLYFLWRPCRPSEEKGVLSWHHCSGSFHLQTPWLSECANPQNTGPENPLVAGCSGNTWSESSTIPKELLVAPAPHRAGRNTTQSKRLKGRIGTLWVGSWDSGHGSCPLAKGGQVTPGEKAQITSQMWGLHRESLLWELMTSGKMWGTPPLLLNRTLHSKAENNRLSVKELVWVLAGSPWKSYWNSESPRQNGD